MGRVFTTLQQLKDGTLDALTSRFARWTKPRGTSAPLATLTDLSKSKSSFSRKTRSYANNSLSSNDK